MKMVGYALFGMAILFLSVFLIAPDKKGARTVEPYTAAVPTSDQEDVSADVGSEIREPTEAAEKETVDTYELVPSSAKPSETDGGTDRDIETLPKRQDLLSSPGELGTDMSGPPDFPPFPPMEADEGPPLAEFPSSGFPEGGVDENPFDDTEDMTLEGTWEGGLDQREF